MSDVPLEVTPEDVLKLREQSPDSLVLVDCRRPEELEIARLENSIHLPLDELAARREELEEHDDKQVIVYCHHGVRSLKAAVFLRQQGIESACSMKGGIEAWSLRIDSGVPRY